MSDVDVDALVVVVVVVGIEEGKSCHNKSCHLESDKKENKGKILKEWTKLKK